MPRGTQEKLFNVAITPAAQAVAGGGGVRVSQGRTRGADRFRAIGGLLNTVSRAVGRQGAQEGQDDATAFHAIREGETTEQRDARVDDKVATLVNRNKLLATSSTPQFHRTLALMEGARVSDLVAANVRAREAELLSLRTGDGPANRDIPSVNDLVNQETDKIREARPKLFEDQLVTNSMNEGLRRFQVDYGVQITARQNALREDIAGELLTDEVTQAVFKLSSLGKVGKQELDVLANMVLEFGHRGVAPRDKRSLALDGIIAGSQQVADSDASVYGPDKAVSLIHSIMDDKGGLVIGGRSVRKDSSDVAALSALEEKILREADVRNSRQNREDEQRKRDDEIFKRGVLRDHTADIFAASQNGGAVAYAKTVDLGIEDPREATLAREALIKRGIELDNLSLAADIDERFTGEVYSLLNSDSPEKRDLAEQMFVDNPEKFTPLARKDLSARFAEADTTLSSVIELPSYRLLTNATSELEAQTLRGLNPNAQGTLARDLSEAESAIRQGAVDLASQGRLDEVPAFINDRLATYKAEAFSRAATLREAGDAFKSEAAEAARSFGSLDTDRLQELADQGALSGKEVLDIQTTFELRQATHFATLDRQADELIREFRAQLQFDPNTGTSALALTNPKLADVLASPIKAKKFEEDTISDFRAQVEVNYREALANAKTPEERAAAPAAALAKSRKELLSEGVFAVSEPAEGSEERETPTTEAAALNFRARDRELFQVLKGASSSEAQETRASMAPVSSEEAFTAAKVLKDAADPTTTVSRARVESTIAKALAVSEGDPQGQQRTALSLIQQGRIPLSAALGGPAVFSAVDEDRLLSDLEATPYFAESKRRREMREVYNNIRENSARAPVGGARPWNGPIPSSIQQIESFLNKRMAEDGLSPANPKYLSDIAVTLKTKDLPFNSSPIDFRVDLAGAVKLGYSQEEFYRGSPIKVAGKAQNYDLTDPAEAFEYFRESRPDEWNSILKAAGVDPKDKAASDLFVVDQHILIQKFLHRSNP